MNYLSWDLGRELMKLNFPFKERPTIANRNYVPTAEDILAELKGPITMSRWKDGSGFSVFDEDVNEDYKHRADGTTLREALARMYILHNQRKEEEFIGITP